MRLSEAFADHGRRDYLVSAGYHTPNGPLHLGHIGGPFLHGNAVARHLESLGNQVSQITGTDAHESYVLLSAVLQDCAPRAVSRPQHAAAATVLTGFGMRQAAFADSGAAPLADEYVRHSQEIARRLVDGGRTVVREVPMMRSRSTGRVIVGPFAVGGCPACGAEAAGTCCEECGVWFGPELLRAPRPRLPVDDRTEPIAVPTVYLRMADTFHRTELARHFPQRYLQLADAYLAVNGPWLPLSHPLGWGVPWQGVAGLPEGTVHTSYVRGTYASNRILKDLFHAATGLGDPFTRDSPVTTVLASGLDAILPCMFLQGLTDPGWDWQPYDHHLLNEFLLLDGEKFSTSRNHVITARRYIDSGLSPDLFRMYAGLLSVPGQAADFNVAAFARFCRTVLAGRLEPLVRQSLDLAAGRPGAWTTSFTSRAQLAVRGRIDALTLCDSDLSLAARQVIDWLEAGETGLAKDEPGGWLRVLCWLTAPFMPAWAQSVWECLGLPGHPRLDGLEDSAPVQPGRYQGFGLPGDAGILALRDPAGNP
ncbi:class I tRNA ligase family protein [Streptomyces sp. NPDC127039]|uniref:class I tRNA ligase family protein n=1 Tax=Streptomyces sp. NPDC127039 TaxID=3347115 RepID=UPI003651A7EB